MTKNHSFTTELPLRNEALGFAADVYMFCEEGKLNASISNNIAEGFEYGNSKVLIRFLTHLKGSAGEAYNCIQSKNDREKRLFKILNKGHGFYKKTGGFIQFIKGLNNNKISSIINSSIRC